MNIEICAPNIQSALNAQKAGATRIELCTAIEVGGVTPSAGLISAAVHLLDIPVNVLIRPREGNFCYSEYELMIMLDDIAFCQDNEAGGVVIGALTNDGFLDLGKMEQMILASEGMEITCHRAFDFVKDPFAALEGLIDLGVHRILTSGLQNSAYEGRFMLQKLVEKADGRITIMAGAGVNYQNIAEIASVSGVSDFHFTAKKKIIQKNPTGDISGLEFAYWEGDLEEMRKIISSKH
jgi:copper homeostasis protein